MNKSLGLETAEPRSHAVAEAVPGLTNMGYSFYPRMVKKFAFDEDILDALVASLSPERLATYMAAAAGDRKTAMRLYTWNTTVSAAFYGPLQGLEVALRNAMHGALTTIYGRDWYDNPLCGFDGKTLQRIEAIKKELKRDRYAVDPPHMVAALSFGFWVALLGHGGRGPDADPKKRNYEMTLWRPCLYMAFPNIRTKRVDVHRRFDYLRTFRNRIAHHEPIFNRHLEADYQSILDVSGWLCLKTRDWVVHHSRVELVLRASKDADDLMF